MNAQQAELKEAYEILRELEKRRCKEDLFYLTRFVLGKALLEKGADRMDWHHKKLCDDLMSLWRKRFEQPTKTTMKVEWPRGTLKSTICSVAFPVWVLLNEPETRILIESETATNALRFLSLIKSSFENKHFQYLFGQRYNPRHRWNLEELTVSRKQEFKEPSVDVGGVDVEKTGQHYDLYIGDDLQGKTNSQTRDQIEKVIHHAKSVYSLMNPNGMVLFPGTRWAHSDLGGYMDELNEADDLALRPRGIHISRYTCWREGENGQMMWGQPEFPGLLPVEELNDMRAKQGPYVFSCNPAGAPILMSDWTNKPIEQVRAGDEVVGFVAGTAGKRGRFLKSKVLDVYSREADVVKVTTEDGHVFRCTPDHKWYTGRNDKSHAQYLPVAVGRSMVRVLDLKQVPNEEQLREYRYLAGLLDGEGQCKYGTPVIAQSRKHNQEVCEAILRSMKAVGIECEEYSQQEKASQFALLGGRNTKHKILQYGKPAKAKQFVDALWHKPGFKCDSAKVVKIEADGKEMVYALRTTTGNYVAWGYASKNCNYLLNPTSDENAIFSNKWLRYHAHTPDELYKMGCEVWISVDPAGEGGFEGADFTAIVVAFISPRYDIFIQDVIREHLTRKELADTLFVLNEQYKPRAIGMEAVLRFRELYTWLKMESQLKGRFLPLRDFKNTNKVKQSRIRELQPVCEAGKLHMRREHKHLEDEMLRFPRGKHDDCLDATAYLLEFMSTPIEEQPREFWEKDPNWAQNWRGDTPPPSASDVRVWRFMKNMGGNSRRRTIFSRPI